MKVVVIDAVGLTPRWLPHAPRLSGVGTMRPWTSPVPAVTATSQTTMLTGRMPKDHGIVGNGWYYRDTDEIRFWQQSHRLIQSPSIESEFETAKMFWWFNGSPPVKYFATPKPHYGSDGSKAFDIIDRTGCDLQSRIGAFPFFAFWGPMAGLDSTRWIAEASSIVIREKQPELTLVYLPHLDYDHQRLSDPPASTVRDLDQEAAKVIDAADSIGAAVVVVSEYGLSPVHRPVHLNRYLRDRGWLGIRHGPFGDQLVPADGVAFAVADHQVAHLYVNDPTRAHEVREGVESIDGVAAVVEPAEFGMDHPRSGRFVVLAEPDAWFTYYFWNAGDAAPDYAPTVDIHRKPGYDPAELFATSKIRAGCRLVQKKLGMRYRMDVVPVDSARVGGSHGLIPGDPNDGPLVIGPTGHADLPATMTGFADYARALLRAN